MGKVAASFVFFLAASALAVHEAKPPPPPRELAPPTHAVDEPPPSRAIHDEVPPWVKYAPPESTPPPRVIVQPAPPVIVQPPRIVLEPSTITIDDGESADIPDAVDKCPDQPGDGEDNDGCPEPVERTILID